MEKTIEEVFKDYTGRSGIINKATILALDLYKKSNKLEVKLKSDEKIPVGEITSFEKYIKTRFQIENVKVVLQYTFEIDLEAEIQQDWKEIVSYMGEKFPLTRAILANSNIAINGTKINVNLNVRGKDILHGRGFDSALADVIESLYGKKYAIAYVENISEEQLQSMENAIKEEEKKAIKKIQTEAVVTKTEEPKSQENLNAEKKEDADDGESPLILGRIPKGNDPITKINDISVDSGNVTIVRKSFEYHFR